jgi:ubiquinone/menaquinone biosynthesis C-methylase UbiE
MDQTPIHDIHNKDVLSMLPLTSKKLMEIGCSSGALAREYKKNNKNCHYIGLDIVESYTHLAKRFCDEVIVADIEQQNEIFYSKIAIVIVGFLQMRLSILSIHGLF